MLGKKTGTAFSASNSVMDLSHVIPEQCCFQRWSSIESISLKGIRSPHTLMMVLSVDCKSSFAEMTCGIRLKSS